MVEKRLNDSLFTHSLSQREIDTAASLAYYGRLKPVEHLQLKNVNLSKVSTEKMASLASSVEEYVYINNVNVCGLASILDQVKCNKLEITDQGLASEEIEALLRAMETRVDEVVIGFCVALKPGLDYIKALTKYSGQGPCGRLVINCDEDTAFKYIEMMEAWATSKSDGWKMMRHHGKGGKGLELVRESMLKRERESSYDRKVKKVRAEEEEKDKE